MTVPSTDSSSSNANPVPATEEPDSAPPILEDAEAEILQSDQPRAKSLLAGTSSSGELMTPVVLENLEGQNHFVVKLDEPLLDSQGEVALPEDSELLVRVDRLSENGLVELSAIQATWETNGIKQQADLPRGVIQIRGEEGDPLVAQQHRDRDNGRLGRDVTRFTLGAIRRSAELYTRSNTRVQTGDRTTVVTENNPDPDILAGALEGGTEEVLDSVDDRTQRATNEQERRPGIPYLRAGTQVQVFVNQSMELEM